MKKSETFKLKSISSDTLLATVDMGMDSFTGYARCPDRSEIKTSDYANNHGGFQAYWEILVRTMEIKGLKQIVLGFESTGPYARPLMHFFEGKRVRLVQVNPFHTKKLKELTGNSPNKTDQKDPKVIADIIELGHSLSVVIPKGAAAELRQLSEARERANKRLTALFNQLHSLVFFSFPGFLQVIKDIKTKSALHLLKHYGNPQDLLALGPDSLIQVIKQTSRGRFGPEKARALFEAATIWLSSGGGCDSVDLEIKEMVRAIENERSFVAQLESRMPQYLKQIPYSSLLLSMKGVGLITVAGIIGEVSDFTHFKTQKEILKLAGIDLYEISSGKHKGQRRISKRGRPLLRKLLFFAAMNTIRKGGTMHQTYQKHLTKGMPRIKALIAIARKLLCIMLALVRTQSVFSVNRKTGFTAAAV